MIDELFESEEIRLEIFKNNIDPVLVSFIKEKLKKKIINKRENMIEGEIKYLIKTELQKDFKKEMEKNKRVNGGYCSTGCSNCCEELLDSHGGVVGEYTDGGMFEYYCDLGHSISWGKFCKDYK